MALIGTIRKNMWFVFVLLGIALVAFMFMDSAGPGGGGGGTTTALSVNGEKIDINEFQRIESMSGNSSGLTGNQLRSKVFDDLITRSIVNEESEALGLSVGEEEMEDLLFGARLSPVIQQMFRNPRTGTVDFQQLQEVRNNIAAEDTNPQFDALWKQKIEEVKTLEIQNKLGTMVTKGIYTPSWMAEELSKTNSISADIEYVKVPFSAIDDSAIELSDADYTAYMKENSSLFNNKEEGRVVEYIKFDIEPTAKDSLDLRNKVISKIDEFKNSDADSTFALRNNGNYMNFFFVTDDIPEAFQNVVPSMEIGEVAGPLLNERYYTALKLIDKAVVADSVGLSHIFRSVAAEDVVARAIANKLLDSIQIELESGRAVWDSMALKNSQDNTNSANGGDLGKITQGQFFPEINQVAFFTGKIGNLYKVESPNGVHLIRVDERIFNDDNPKYKVAFINEPIEPSDETIDAITGKAIQFISDNRTLESARASIGGYPEASIATSKVLKKGDYEFEGFGFKDDARNIVVWAFNENTSVGSVSPDVYSFRDQLFNYESSLVIPALQAKTKKGMANLADVKNSITPQVTDFAKARKIAEQMKGKSMTEIQSAMAGATSGSITGARTSSGILQNIGSEPKVVAAIISTSEGQSSQPIVGNTGVYQIVVSNKSSNTNPNQVFAKQSENIKARQNVNFLLMNALKDEADVKDKRMDFGM